MGTADPEQSEATTRFAASPATWVLVDDRPGHTTQAVGLAQALGWPYQTKAVDFWALNRVSNHLLRASSWSMRPSSRAQLKPPWPDLVISMGRRTAPVARWIQKRSGGKTRLVQLGRKGANNPEPFDLTIVCQHFRFPPHPKRLHVLLPITRVRQPDLAAAAQEWSALFGDLPRPWVSLIVGGSTSQHQLAPADAASMARNVNEYARGLGGSPAVVTSRRTGAAVTDAMLAQLPPGTPIYRWRPDDPQNPYLGHLAQADILVVTGESESMLAEAAATGKSLEIYPLQEKKPGLKGAFANAITDAAHARKSIVLGRLCAALLQRGLVIPSRDLKLLHAGMVNAGLAKIFGDSAPPPVPIRPTDDLDRSVSRVSGLFPTTA